jgi:hypothetical protein
VLLAAAAPAFADDSPAAAAGETVLATGSYWRVFARSAQAVVGPQFAEAGASAPQIPKAVGRLPESLPPPAGWAGAAFDDSSWFRTPCPPGALPAGCKGLYLRGKFAVADPAGVRRLELSMAFRGGVVVYLNGREVHRSHVPAGRLTPRTAALPYPPEAYVGPRGRILSTQGEANRPSARDRRLGPVALPTQALRRGVNVLAIEVRRADFRPEALRWAKRARGVAWAHVGVRSIRLNDAAAAGAITANVRRPRGLQVYNQDIHRVFAVSEYGDPNEPLRPIRLVGARNGFYSGQVVVSSTDALVNLRAAAGDLAGPGGARIPAAAVRVRYVAASRMRISASHAGLAYPGWSPVPAFVALMDEPPAEVTPSTLKTDPRQREALGLPPTLVPAAVQPIWVTVHVPADCAPGEYRGTLAVTADGVDVKVPVELTALRWVAPDPADWVTFMTANQSPETLAVRYKVPMWSQRHWALMERSWRLLGHIGNRLLVVPLVCRTQYGNDDSYVPFVRQADGSYAYDFSVYERLVALARRHCDLRVIAYQVYLPLGWTPPPAAKPVSVTQVDAGSGARGKLQLPAYGTPDSKRLWRPLIEQLRARNRKLGVDGKVTLVLGLGQDGGIHKTVREQFAALFPEAKWQYGAHNRVPRFYDIRRGRGHRTYYAYSEYLYVAQIPPLGGERMYGWRLNPFPVVMSQRIHDGGQPPMITRTMAERALIRGDSGAGRMCLDYWDVPGVKRHAHYGTMYSRWPQSTASQRTPHLKALAWPGPDGPVSSIKLEPMREGIQEAEARIRIEKALLGGRLPATLAAEAQALLDRRHDAMRRIDYIREPVRAACNRGWQAEAAALYEMAARVQEAAGGAQ